MTLIVRCNQAPLNNEIKSALINFMAGKGKALINFILPTSCTMEQSVLVTWKKRDFRKTKLTVEHILIVLSAKHPILSLQQSFHIHVQCHNISTAIARQSSRSIQIFRQELSFTKWLSEERWNAGPDKRSIIIDYNSRDHEAFVTLPVHLQRRLRPTERLLFFFTSELLGLLFLFASEDGVCDYLSIPLFASSTTVRNAASNRSSLGFLSSSF